MKGDLESQLRAALRPVAPSDDFAEKVMARVAAKRRLRSRAWWIPASLAACTLIAVGVHRHNNGMEARRELVEALRVTSQKLDLAYAVVKNQSGV
jgi:hypothetical protein